MDRSEGHSTGAEASLPLKWDLVLQSMRDQKTAKQPSRKWSWPGPFLEEHLTQ